MGAQSESDAAVVERCPGATSGAGLKPLLLAVLEGALNGRFTHVKRQRVAILSASHASLQINGARRNWRGL